MADSNDVTSSQRIVDYSRFLSKTAKRIKLNLLKERNLSSSAVNMDGGYPHEMEFPFSSAVLSLADGESMYLNDAEMKSVQQYSSGRGLQSLHSWLIDFCKKVFQPPTLNDKQLPSSLSIRLCSGGREAIVQTMNAILDEGDSVLAEEAIFQMCAPYFMVNGVRGVPIGRDSEGMDAVHLREVLSKWDEGVQGRRPRLLYCTPTSGNPTGRTWSVSRKQEIYNIVKEFDFLILEDDPYYFLQFEKPFSPSFLSLDTDGRVIRADSFSKTLTPGFRVGFVIGPQGLIEKISQAIYLNTRDPSNISQILLQKLLARWGVDRYLQHTERMAKHYQQRATILETYASKYLTGLCEWQFPSGGMFFWMKILGIKDSRHIVKLLEEKDIHIMAGSLFTVRSENPSPFVRLSFSIATDSEMDQCVRLLADTIKHVKTAKPKEA